MPQRKPTKNGWKNRVSAPIKGLKCSWQWCCTPCARKQVHCCAKQCKVVSHILHILHIIHVCLDNIWFCKLLLLFKIHTRTDTGMQYRECAYVSVLEEYTGPRKPGHILHIMHIMHILICRSTNNILCVYHSVGWTVSICNDLWELWASTSLVCDSSILHSGTPSSSPCGCNRDNTLCHALRISRLSWSIMLQISEQWWWM